MFFLFAFSIHAQHDNSAAGKITGRIIDSLTGKPIEYATIGLFTQTENKVVNGTTADSTGAFKLIRIAEGTYKIQIDFIGYNRIEKNNVLVSKGTPAVVLGNIKLVNSQTALKEVTISTDKNVIENKIDKLVYNVDKDITGQTGVASDILKKVPQVSVDVDGNVELQGNSNIRFLINGKPSTIFGSNITDVLQSIPASQIQSIEVITSPGAKYDAEGTGGIINIILKKSTAQGFNGNVSLSGGTRLENGSVNLNARKGKFGVNAFLSGNAQLLSKTLNTSDRTAQDSSSSSKLLQNGAYDFQRHGFQSGVGFDWDINPHNNLSGAVGYNYYGNSNVGTSNRQTILQDASGNNLSTVNDAISATNKFHIQPYDYSLNYKKKFDKEDQELEVLFNSSNANIYSYYDQQQQHLSPVQIFNGSYGTVTGVQKETEIAANYTHPISKDVKIETGVKNVIYLLNAASDVYLQNTSTGAFDYNSMQSSSINYRRNIYACYLSSSFKLFKLLDVKAGGRYEYTVTKADFLNIGFVNIAPYNTYVPSLVISRSFKHNQTLKIAYSHRIERPDGRDLNPFLNVSDPKNITTGNPNLRPEIGNKIQLSYNKSFEKGANINTTLFYSGNTDDIQSYTRYYPTFKIGDSTYTNVAISTRENIGREDNVGLSIFASLPIIEKINIRTNINLFERYITTGIPSGGNIHGFNYRINMNATYQLSSTLTIELFGNYNSSRINAQGTMPAWFTYNFAFRKQLFHKNGSIALTATNPFSEYVNQKTNLTGENFVLYNNRQLPYRSFGFNFTYKFGKMEFKKEKEAEDINLTNPPGNEK